MDEETKPKRKAKDNPWYKLATFHGEPASADDEIAAKNRVTWNRWMASRISDDLRAVLRKRGWSEEELTPFAADEPKPWAELSLKAETIDLQDTEFEAAFFAEGFVFPSISLRGAAFSGRASFNSAAFSDVASFVNAEMKSVTSFTNVKLARPPMFFGSKLHEGTTWRDVAWPVLPEDREQAAEYVEAYERLKLEMDRLKKHGDELDFFARELQCRGVLIGFWKGLPIGMYGFLSDYGRSYTRPLLLLVQTVLIGAIPLLVVPLRIANTRVFQRGSAAEAIGISFANTLSILGKPLIEADVLLGLPNWLKAIATLQSILGIAFLFLFGLGIRNRFRMK